MTRPPCGLYDDLGWLVVLDDWFGLSGLNVWYSAKRSRVHLKMERDSKKREWINENKKWKHKLVINVGSKNEKKVFN